MVLPGSFLQLKIGTKSGCRAVKFSELLYPPGTDKASGSHRVWKKTDGHCSSLTCPFPSEGVVSSSVPGYLEAGQPIHPSSSGVLIYCSNRSPTVSWVWILFETQKEMVMFCQGQRSNPSWLFDLMEGNLSFEHWGTQMTNLRTMYSWSHWWNEWILRGLGCAAQAHSSNLSVSSCPLPEGSWLNGKCIFH